MRATTSSPENGALLAESKMFTQGIIYADIDLQRLAHERQRMNTFESIEGGVFSFSLEPVENDLADRTFPRTPVRSGEQGAPR